MQVWIRVLLVAASVVVHSWAKEETYSGYVGRWVEVVATAYSPRDPIDHHYRESKGSRWRWIAADGRTDVRDVPYGIAVPNINGRPLIPFGTKVIVPLGQGYLDQSRPSDRVFAVDDTGAGISNATRATGVMHFDMRFAQTGWASRWGSKPMRVFVVLRRVVSDAAKDPYVDLRDDPFWDPALDR